MQQIALLDTAVCSDNLGDEIIMEAVRDELFSLFPDCYFTSVATHDSLGRTARHLLRSAEIGIVGGTNFISSSLLRNSGWKITALDLLWLHDVVMMGVGWRDYQRPASTYARIVYGKALSRRHVHSCRDEYSAGRLRSLGFEVVNTSCPTLWRLTPEACRLIPRRKAKSVVMALTSYRPDTRADTELLRLLEDSYDTVHFWTQQIADRQYVRSLEPRRLSFIPPNLRSLNSILDAGDLDYVGSRLHGGIRALQRGRRSLILSVDNRAAEIGRDTGLPVIDRNDIAAVRGWIAAPFDTDIRLPHAAIDAWKGQFTALKAAPRSSASRGEEVMVHEGQGV